MDYSHVAAEGRLEKLRDIAEKIVALFPCRVISHPSPGMVMVRHLDPIEKTPFYLGEAFVTQCEVELDGNLGYGCVLGNEPERAVYGAIIDAGFGNDMNIPGEVKRMLDVEAEYINEKRNIENRQIAGTKVNFDVKKE